MVRAVILLAQNLPSDATALLLMSFGLILGLVGVLLSSADIFVRLGLAFFGGLLDVVTFTSCSSLIKAPQLFPRICARGSRGAPNPYVKIAEVGLTVTGVGAPLVIAKGI